jgi:hypothetical protein
MSLDLKTDGHKIIVTIILAVSFLTLTAFFGFPLLCSFIFPCTNEIKSEIDSPDQYLKAVIFSRDCGATTGDSRQVSVIAKNSSLPDESGNIFVEDSGYSATPTLIVYVTWTGPRELCISYDPKARVFLSKKNIDIKTGFFEQVKLRISYRTLTGKPIK